MYYGRIVKTSLVFPTHTYVAHRSNTRGGAGSNNTSGNPSSRTIGSTRIVRITTKGRSKSTKRRAREHN